MSGQEMIRVTVTLTGDGDSMAGTEPLELEVAAEQTVSATKEMVGALDKTIAVDDLRLDGVSVDDSATLSTVVAQHSEPLRFTAERRTLEVSAGPVKRRKRCSVPSCTSSILRGAGHCGNCDGMFCSRHRLMEQHQCSGLQGCKQQLHERNALRLQQQQTVAHKV